MAAAYYPEDTYLLGTSAAPLAIRNEASSSTIRFSTEGRHQLAVLWATDPELRGQLYLKLNHLRGSHDAVMLNVYVALFTDTIRHPPILAGSWALYGLRMASLQHADSSGTGLSKSFPVTQLLPAWLVSSNATLSVSIVPSHPLPESANLVLEGISLYYLPTN
jgi:hypothetical protein